MLEEDDDDSEEVEYVSLDSIEEELDPPQAAPTSPPVGAEHESPGDLNAAATMMMSREEMRRRRELLEAEGLDDPPDSGGDGRARVWSPPTGRRK